MVEPAMRFVGATVYLIISILTIVLNGLLIIVLGNLNNTKIKRSFYFIIWQITICGLLSQFVELTLVVPGTYAGYDIFKYKQIPRAIGFIDAISYNGLLYFSLTLAISRLAAIVFPRVNTMFFEGRTIFVTIFVVWSIDGIFITVTLLTGCWNTFDFEGFFLKHECQPDLSEFAIQLGRVWGANTANYFPALMMAIYLVLFLYVRFSFNIASGSVAYIKKRRRQEYLLLMQGFIISSYLELQNIAFMYFPHIADPIGFVTFLQNVIVLVGSAVNAAVIFCFNNEIRSSVLFSSSTMTGNASNPVLPGIRLAGAATYLIINVISLILSILLAVVLWKSGDLKFKRTFFIVIIQHLISDMMSEFVQLTLVVPATFAGYNVSSVLSFLDNVV
uniref:G_PROTEIN_RECEP_F1_2 domain-containing protein n=1 Tax=Steinernema glaseri TaxID=37863 RepID=A0A1I7YIK4_9BILA